MAPVQAQDAPTRDLRVRQTLELQRGMEKKEEVRSSAVISPRSKSLIAGVSDVLERYNYGEAEIHSLVKRCGYDEGRIQAAVSNILEDKRGHEHDEWSTTATASEKKLRAQEAKERRIQREREQAEEAERQRAQRTKAADEKMRRTMEEAGKRRSTDTVLGQQGSVRGAGRGWGGWRPVAQETTASPDQNDDLHETASASCADDNAQEPTSSHEEMKRDEPANEDMASGENSHPSKDELATRHDEEPVPQSMRETVTGDPGAPAQLQAPGWGSAPVLPETGGIWTSPPTGVAPGHSQAQGGPWASPWLSNTAPWSAGGLGGMLMPEHPPGAVPSTAEATLPTSVPPAAGTWVPRSAPTVSAPTEAPPIQVPEQFKDDINTTLDSPWVVIPASYAALLGSGPAVMFGSFNISETAPAAAPALQPVQPAQTKEETPISAAAEAEDATPPQEEQLDQEMQQRKERPPRTSARPPRGEAWAPKIKAWAPRSTESQSQEPPGDLGTRPPRGGGRGRGGGRASRGEGGVSSSDVAPSSSGNHRNEGGGMAEDGKGGSKGDGKGRAPKKGSGRAGGRKGTGKGYWTERQQGGAGK